MAFITYSLDDRFHRPTFHVDDERYVVLGIWVMCDITYLEAALSGLAVIEDIVHDRASADELSGEGYDVTRTPDGLRFSPALAPGEATYSIAEVREALERYWEFMSTLPENPNIQRSYRPDLPEWQAALFYFEEQRGTPHPYGKRLFRPPAVPRQEPGTPNRRRRRPRA